MAGSLINPTGLTKSMFVAPDLPDKVDTTGFANTMMALQDPAGALSRRQNEQIAETTAGMTLDGLQGDILNAGFRDWDNYKTKYKDYLSSNKGFARLRLDTQQKAEMDREKQKLSANVWWGKKVQQNYIDVLKQARVDAVAGHIDPAELQAFEDKWVDLVKNNKGGLGDLPMPETLYANMVHPKPKVAKPEDLQKELNEYDNKIVTRFSGLRAGSTSPEEVAKGIALEFPSGSVRWEDYKNKCIKDKTVDPSDSDDVARMKIATRLSGVIKPKSPPSSVLFPKEQKEKPKIEATQDGSFPMGAYDVKLPGTIPITSGGKTANVAGTKEITDISPDPQTGKLVITYNATYKRGTHTKTKADVREELTPDIITKLEKQGYDVSELRETYKKSLQATPNTIKKYLYNGKPYSYDELDNAGVDVKKAIKENKITLAK